MPKLSIEYISKIRDVKYYELLLEALAKQYELARVEEARGGAPIQVVDTAAPPDKKSGPKRGLFVFLTWVVTSFLAVLVALVTERMQRTESGPNSRLRELLRLFGKAKRSTDI